MENSAVDRQTETIETTATVSKTLFHLCASKASRFCSWVETLHLAHGKCRILRPDLVVVESQRGTIDWIDLIKSTGIHRHITRVYHIDGSADSKDSVLEIVTTRAKDSDVYRIQAYPKAMEEFVKEKFPLKINLHPKNYTEVIHLIQISQSVILYGFQSRAEFYHQETPRVEISETISRASNKLEEVVQLKYIGLDESHQAMDIGASPGGWTNILSKHAKRVVAIDPADLDPSLLKPNIVHLKMKLEESTSELEKYGPFDVIVCDANREPIRFAQWLLIVIPFLKAGGKVVMTLKMQSIFRSTKSGATTIDTKKLEAVLDLFRETLEGITVHWLFANSVHERTLIASKK